MATARKAAGTAAKATRETATKTAKTKGVAAKKAAPAVVKPIKSAFTKTELFKHLAAAVSVETKLVKEVLGALESTIAMSLRKNGLGEFTLPGLFKVSVVNVPAKKKRFGKDPFTGQERWFPAKPASKKIKIRALKKLKDMTAR
jgi:nucleoid DNA-binding protein